MSLPGVLLLAGVPPADPSALWVTLPPAERAGRVTAGPQRHGAPLRVCWQGLGLDYGGLWVTGGGQSGWLTACPGRSVRRPGRVYPVTLRATLTAWGVWQRRERAAGLWLRQPAVGGFLQCLAGDWVVMPGAGRGARQPAELLSASPWPVAIPPAGGQWFSRVRRGARTHDALA